MIIFPFNFFTNSLAILNPNPDPCSLRFRELSILKKGLKIFFLNLSGTPGPSSSTLIIRLLSILLTSTKILFPYFEAFSIRLNIILNRLFLFVLILRFFLHLRSTILLSLGLEFKISLKSL